MISKQGKREYKEIAGERFPAKCIHDIMVDVDLIEHYRKCANAANQGAEIEIKEQRIKDPETPVDTFMLIDIIDMKDGWFHIVFWASL